MKKLLIFLILLAMAVPAQADSKKIASCVALISSGAYMHYSATELRQKYGELEILDSLEKSGDFNMLIGSIVIFYDLYIDDDGPCELIVMPGLDSGLIGVKYSF